MHFDLLFKTVIKPVINLFIKQKLSLEADLVTHAFSLLLFLAFIVDLEYNILHVLVLLIIFVQIVDLLGSFLTHAHYAGHSFWS